MKRRLFPFPKPLEPEGEVKDFVEFFPLAYSLIRSNYESNKSIHMIMSDDDEKLMSCEIASQQLDLHDQFESSGGISQCWRVESSAGNLTVTEAKTRKEADEGVEGGGERGRWRRAKVASEEEEAEPVLVGALSLIPRPKLWLMIRCEATMADYVLTHSHYKS